MTTGTGWTASHTVCIFIVNIWSNCSYEHVNFFFQGSNFQRHHHGSSGKITWVSASMCVCVCVSVQHGQIKPEWGPDCLQEFFSGPRGRFMDTKGAGGQSLHSMSSLCCEHMCCGIGWRRYKGRYTIPLIKGLTGQTAHINLESTKNRQTQ